jgi:hypothetical protein
LAKAVAVTLVASSAVLGAGAGGAATAADEQPQSTYDEPAIHASFAARSFAPETTAPLLIDGDVRRVRVRIFRAARRTSRDDVMAGFPFGAERELALEPHHGRARIDIGLGAWPSGLYFARLRSRDGRVGFAPFVLRPARLGEHPVAVVLPTNTWQAYNFRDANGDGLGDTWYASPSVRSVELRRPFLHRGVPPHFRQYDAGFLHWLLQRHAQVDVLSDDDFNRIASGDRLAEWYRLVIFPGHEEYVTEHAYDIAERYRDLGGNLMFLSANNFFRRVIVRGDRIYRSERFRDIGRPESALVGVQYLDWNHLRWGNRPYVVVGARSTPWAFRGTGLHDGSRFGAYGIEIDRRTRRSPRGTKVLAVVPNVFGPGRSAEMTYYETRAGAKVFAAGTINFGSTSWFQPTATILANLWARLSQP